MVLRTFPSKNIYSTTSSLPHGHISSAIENPSKENKDTYNWRVEENSEALFYVKFLVSGD